MGLTDQLTHLLNFFAPALVVGVVLAWVGPLVAERKRPLVGTTLAQAAMNCIAGGLALGLGLWFFGRDGKMASYGAMLVASTACQWVGSRAWR